ncbi:MAG: MBL fold metallo-hydrolase [Actinomycetota bacterium]
MAVGDRWTIGDVRITSIIESDSSWKWRWLLPDVDDDLVDEIGWLRPSYAGDGGRFPMRIQGFVVEVRDRRIVVDTCVGNDKPRNTPLFDRLDTTFLTDLDSVCPVEDVETVVCTHLHVDHVGWNTRRRDGSWVPTFEGARHLFARAEYEHWAEDTDEMSVAVQADSVDPLVHAGLVDLVEPDHAICDEVTLEATHGHTPGHVSVRIASRGASAVITGDMTHHPIQLTRPGICSSADVDPAASTRTRHEAFARWAEAGTLVIGSHYAQPSAGRLVEHEGGWRLS